MRDVAACTKTVVSIVPQSFSASGTANGTAVDRLGFQSAALVGIHGAVTGTPATAPVTHKLQESPDGTNSWTDVTGATITLSGASTQGQKGVNLTALKRYLRVVTTAALTGGTSPTVMASGVLVLGQAQTEPTA